MTKLESALWTITGNWLYNKVREHMKAKTSNFHVKPFWELPESQANQFEKLAKEIQEVIPQYVEPSDLQKARVVKTKMMSSYGNYPFVAGIGICVKDNKYAVQVSVLTHLMTIFTFPREMDGVAIVVQHLEGPATVYGN